MTDVRYRLSAEGVAEVVAAFRKVQTEAQKSAGGVQRSFAGFGASLSSITGLLSGVSAAIGGIGLLNLVKEAANAGEELQNLHQRFSSSIEDLSALSVAARQTGSDMGSLARPLTKLFNDMTEASKDLSGETADRFRDFGLSTREIQNFAKQDLAARLETLGKAFASLPEGTERSNVALAELKERGAVLIPILNLIAKEGFAGLRTETERLSSKLDPEMVQAMAAVNKSMGDLKTESQGLASQFVTGLAPGFTAGTRASIDMTTEISKQTNIWRILGRVIGEVVGATMVLITTALDSLATRFGTLEVNFEMLFRAGAAAATGNFSEAQALLQGVGARRTREDKALAERVNKAWDDFFHRDKQRADDRTKANTGGLDDTARREEASTRARIAAQKAGIDAELALTKAGLKLRENDEEAFFRDGLTSLQKFYEARRRIAADGINAEIVALQKQRIVASQDKDKGVAEIAKIDGQIAKLALDRRDQLNDLNAKEIADYRALAEEILNMDRDIFEARGEHHAAALLQIDEQVRKADELLAKRGGDQADNAAALRNLQTALSSAAEFDRISREANLTLADFGRDRAEIERLAGAGLISQAEAENRILDLERARIESLRAISDELLKAAEINGDPEKIARAQDFAASVDEVSIALEHQDEAFRQLASGGLDIAQNALADFLGTGISQAPTFAAAMRSMAQSVAASLQRLLGQFIALRIATGLTRLFGSAAAAPVRGIANQAPDVFTGAEGGVVTGPGTGTSDSVLARLSAGEYVVRADAVAQPGALGLLELLNAGAARLGPRAYPTHHYASGGIVEPGGGRSGARLDGNLTLGLEDGLVLKALESPEGQRIIIRTLSKNRRAATRSLGGG